MCRHKCYHVSVGRREPNGENKIIRRFPTMSINSYHYFHRNDREVWYNGKRKPHSNDMADMAHTRCYGIEYEISFRDWNIDRNAVSDRLQAVMGHTDTEDGRLKCESDGSVQNGFECISYPATFGCHMACYGWDKFFEVLGEYDMNETTLGGNGMHIHVSRDALGNSADAIDLCIAKLIFLFDNFATMFGKIGGRTYARSRWAACNGANIATTDKSAVAVYKAKQTDGNRYQAVNLTNEHTVEFRIFAVDNRLDHFKARIQFIDWLIDYCKGNTMTTIYETTPATLKAGMRDANPEKYGELQSLLTEIYGA